MIAALLALGGAGLLAANAEARLTFPPPQTISATGEGASGPELAVDSQDRATVVWLRFDGANGRIESVRLSADGAPEEVETLFATSEDSLLPPQVAVDQQGRATVAWERDGFGFNAGECSPPGPPTCVQAIHLDANGNPGTLHTLANFDTPERDPDLGGPGDGPRVAVDSQGRATVVWRPGPDIRQTVQTVRLSPDGAPGPVQTLSENEAGDPKIAIDSQDRATVVWSRFDGTRTRIESVRLGADGAPEQIKTLSKRRQNADFPQVAVDQRGSATVVWQRTDRRKRRIQLVHVGADGTPGAVKTLSRGAEAPEVAVDPRGRATVVWARVKRAKRGRFVVRVQSVQLRPNGRPRAVKTLSKSFAGTPQVAVDSRGRATVVWERLLNRRTSQIEARRLGVGGAPEAVQTLAKGEGRFSPEVGVDSKGRPTVAWAVSDLSIGGLIQSTRGRDSR